MKYALLVLPRAVKEMRSLPDESRVRVRKTVQGLAEEPRPSGCLKLTGRDGWRLRVGRYRVLYDVDDTRHEVTILHVGHRSDVYR